MGGLTQEALSSHLQSGITQGWRLPFRLHLGVPGGKPGPCASPSGKLVRLDSGRRWEAGLPLFPKGSAHAPTWASSSSRAQTRGHIYIKVHLPSHIPRMNNSSVDCRKSLGKVIFSSEEWFFV